LDEETVDLLELDGADLVTHHFEQRTQAEIAGAAQEALARAPDASQRFLGKGIVQGCIKLRIGPRTVPVRST
jgi:hypothetical protein